MFYDAQGNPSFTQQNNNVHTQGGRKEFSSEAYGLKGDWGYDRNEVRSNDTAMIRYRHPETGEWKETTKGMGEAIWRNLTQGGYYTDADKANNFQIVEGKYGKSLDLANSFIHSDNRQNQIQMSNDMYNANPEMAIGFRLQQIDDWFRSEHMKKTGEQVPPNYFIENGKAIEQLNKAGLDSNMVNSVAGNFKVNQQASQQIPQQGGQSNNPMQWQDDMVIQMQREYEQQMIEQQRRLAQQQAEFEKALQAQKAQEKEFNNQNKYLDSERNNNSSWKDDSYKAEIKDNGINTAISKYLNELEKKGGK